MDPESGSRDRASRSWLQTPSLSELRQEVSGLVDSFLSDTVPQWRGGQYPRIDLIELPGSLEIQADLPGYKSTEVTVELIENHLVLSSHRVTGAAPDPDERRYHRVERRQANFTRSILLPCPIDDSRVEASLHDGVLTVRLPKREDSRRHHVPIRAAESATVATPVNSPNFETQSPAEPAD